MSLRRYRRQFTAAALVALALLLSACDPPGKPGVQDEQLEGPTDFAGIYADNCSGCHGTNGRQGAGRVLNNALYLAVSSKENIRNIVRNGRPGTLMPAFAKSNGGPLNDQQVNTLIDGMQSEWAKPFDAKGTTLPPYDLSGFTGDPGSGRKLFLRACFACHAKGGVAGPVNDKNYLSLSSNQNLRTSIIVGRPDFPGIPMPDYRTLNAGHALMPQDIADIVAFLSSLRPATSPIAMLEAPAINTEGMKK